MQIIARKPAIFECKVCRAAIGFHITHIPIVFGSGDIQGFEHGTQVGEIWNLLCILKNQIHGAFSDGFDYGNECRRKQTQQ